MIQAFGFCSRLFEVSVEVYRQSQDRWFMMENHGDGQLSVDVGRVTLHFTWFSMWDNRRHSSVTPVKGDDNDQFSDIHGRS